MPNHDGVNDYNARLAIAISAFEASRETVKAQETRASQFITGSAFFLTAVAALLSNAQVRNFKYRFRNGATANLPALVLILSLLLDAFSVLHSIMTLGPQVRHFQHVSLRRPSMLSFLSITERPSSEWDRLFDPNTSELKLSEYRLQMYAREARELAMEADYRHGRLGEARASMFLAVAALALALVFVLDAISQKPGDALIPWSGKTAIAAGLVVSVVTFVAGRDRVRIEADIDAPRDLGSSVWILSVYSLLMPFTAGLSIMAISFGWKCIALSILTVLLMAIAFVIRVHSRRMTSWRMMDKLSPVFLTSIAISPLLIYSFPNARVFLLLVSLLPLGFFEVTRSVDLMDLITWPARRKAYAWAKKENRREGDWYGASHDIDNG